MISAFAGAELKSTIAAAPAAAICCGLLDFDDTHTHTEGEREKEMLVLTTFKERKKSNSLLAGVKAHTERAVPFPFVSERE